MILVHFEVDEKSEKGFTALHIAAQEGNLGAVRALVEVGKADMEVENDAGATALYWAAYFGRDQVITYLIEAGEYVK